MSAISLGKSEALIRLLQADFQDRTPSSSPRRARGILLTGEAGAGKSSLVARLAKSMAVPWVRHFCAPWHGCAELCRRAPGSTAEPPVLDQARLLAEQSGRVIVFLDEADKVPPASDFWGCLLSAMDSGLFPGFSIPVDSLIFVLAANDGSQIPRYILRRLFRVVVADDWDSATDSVRNRTGIQAETIEKLFRVVGYGTGRSDSPTTREVISALRYLRLAQTPQEARLALSGWLSRSGSLDDATFQAILEALQADPVIGDWPALQALREASNG